MRQQLSFRQYRRIDLFFFAAILCLCEGLIVFAATRWFPGEPFVLSLTGAVCAVVLFRWGPWAGIHAVLGGALLCALSRSPLREYVIYCAGNLACLVMLIPLQRVGWQRIRDSAFACVAFGLAATVLMQTGRALVTFLFRQDLALCLMHYTTDVLSGLFSAVVMWIARRLDGILEEQGHYVKRIGRETADENESVKAGRMEP